MRFDPSHVETLLAIVEEGSFDGAARRLHLTPSAVSQRIKALEGAAGSVLLMRTTPVRATPAATPLLQLAHQFALLDAEAGLALGGPSASGTAIGMAVAVNADSLSGWFRSVLRATAVHGDLALRLQVEDETWSHALLREGAVVAAVTSSPSAVQGCSVEPLGRMRYRPTASPELIERFRHGRSFRWDRAPMVVFNEKDDLQDVALTARGVVRPPLVHRVPSSADFREAIRCGLGWGMLPTHHLEEDLADGRVALVPGGTPVDVPLFWQRWRLASPTLDWLSEQVRAAAR